MGSTGSGSFSDYPGSRPKEGGEGAGSGGASGEDRCARAFSCVLEEVEQCDYFAASGGVPPANTALTIEHSGRLFAVDASGQTVGALPTSLNYLADCMAEGFTYEGRVNSSASAPVASVSVDFAPRTP
ncbi:hypothetical protein RIdsm_01004 [Roseovarius indicus]|uniref:Uncharacterized protein n=1 Tax=Roseovarius indicus TaxID=540747 RepID=A0A0T5P3U1_9RHOB|nr:hypothetical protein XM52_22325 [Roseovarius indicus]QEW25219.1 hypothetical protein RIdsm_01004 [Roseovarius indicus]SFE18709.1 hypothetical protein SAMN04488031_106106 [Roseovarius indicus]